MGDDTSKLKVAVNGRDLSKEGGGTKTYLESVLTELSDREPTDNVSFHVFHNSERHRGGFFRMSETFLSVTNPLLFDFVWFPFFVRRGEFDAVFSPKNVAPFFLQLPTVVTVHDLGYFKSFGFYPFIDRVYMRTLIPLSLRNAESIVAVSKNTKEDIIEHMSIEESKISVIYEAASPKFEEKPNEKWVREVEEKYSGEGPLVFFPGGYGKRKNVRVLVEAFLNSSVEDARLVITGSVERENDQKARRLISKSDRVERIGYIEKTKLRALYHVADVVVYPSLYEGFGLPLLEAMQAGTPVVASNRSSIPEVVGDAGVLVDPENPEEITTALDRVLSDDKLRRELSRSGRERATKFSWSRTVDELLEVFESLVER